jgi:hypothetical protein
MTDPKKCTIKLPSFLEITGHGTSLGKSLIATTAALVYSI